jgi:uncharacterized protein (TIGR02270 family)
MPKVIPEIVDQHAEEAAFLWLLRDAAVRAPHYLLADLRRLDQRVEAHLAGLRLFCDEAWDLVKKAAEEHEAGEVFAASVLAFGSGSAQQIQDMLQVGPATPEKARGLTSALGWLPFEQVEKHLKPLLTAESPVHRRAALAACAIHRRNPDRPLLDALLDPDPPLRARALRAAGELGLVHTHLTLRKSFQADDAACRFWSAWSAALLISDRDALASLQAFAEKPGPFAERAALLVARSPEPGVAQALQRRLERLPEAARQAVLAVGALGDPELVPWLIEQMQQPPLARIAGEALSTITGVHLAYDKLEGEMPEGFEAGPTEQPEDESVAMDPDLDLAWPDPRLVQAWWKSNQGRFRRGTRYLAGKQIEPESLKEVLRTGYQRQRAAAALEMALREPEKGLFEVRAPGWRQ